MELKFPGSLKGSLKLRRIQEAVLQAVVGVATDIQFLNEPSTVQDLDNAGLGVFH